MILGLAGAKHAGKNTVAEFITEGFGDKYEVREWSFAEDLKKSAAAALGIKTDDPVAWAEDFKENQYIDIYLHDTDEVAGYQVHHVEGREFLQYYGTEAHREIFGDQFWVDNLLTKIDNDYEDGGLSRLDIITDVRFPNEAFTIKHASVAWENIGPGKVIKINRPEVENSGDTHASEIPLPDDLVDYELNNVGTLEELREGTKWLIREVITDTIANKVPYA